MKQKEILMHNLLNNELNNTLVLCAPCQLIGMLTEYMTLMIQLC